MADMTLGSRSAIKGSVWVLVLSLAYAVVRYNIARNVSYDQLPLYIGNKAMAMATVIVIGLSFALGPLAHFWPGTFARFTPLKKSYGIIGFAMAAIHAIMSLILLSPAYYSRLYLASGKLTATGELTMLLGILAFVIFSAVAATSLPGVASTMRPEQWQRMMRLGYVAYFLVLLHVGIMGWGGWWRASSWQWGLASISLISCFVIVLVMCLRLFVAGSKSTPSATIDHPAPNA